MKCIKTSYFKYTSGEYFGFTVSHCLDSYIANNNEKMKGN